MRRKRGKQSKRRGRIRILTGILAAEGIAVLILFVIIPAFSGSGSDSGKRNGLARVGNLSDFSGFVETIPENERVVSTVGNSGGISAGAGNANGAAGAESADGSFEENTGESSEEMPGGESAEASRATVTVERTFYFLGDSRTVGMYRAVTGRNNVTDGTVFDTDRNQYGWAASNGQGLAWAKASGASFIDGSVGSGCAVVVLLGINDVTGGETEAEAYASFLNEKAALWKSMGGAETFWVSVNPVNGTISGIDNAKIETFNQQVRAGLSDDVWYLDTYYELSGQFDTTDRLHYTDETYQKIYDRLQQDVMIRYADDGVPVAVEG